jgi:hypothetical protein
MRTRLTLFLAISTVTTLKLANGDISDQCKKDIQAYETGTSILPTLWALQSKYWLNLRRIEKTYRLF